MNLADLKPDAHEWAAIVATVNVVLAGLYLRDARREVRKIREDLRRLIQSHDVQKRQY